jgi:hypothetical protein
MTSKTVCHVGSRTIKAGHLSPWNLPNSPYENFPTLPDLHRVPHGVFSVTEALRELLANENPNPWRPEPGLPGRHSIFTTAGHQRPGQGRTGT